MWKTYTTQAKAVSMPYFGYAFIHDSDTAAMRKATFDLLEGAAFAIDWEAADAGMNSMPPWQDAYEAYANRQGLGYYGISPTGLKPGQTIPARCGDWPRWFPEYASTAKIPACTTLDKQDWRKAYLIWQYSESGKISGINGNVDMNHGSPVLSIDQFVNWLNTGSFGAAPTPKPTPVPTPAPKPPVAVFTPPKIAEWQKLLGYPVTGVMSISLAMAIRTYYNNHPDKS